MFNGLCSQEFFYRYFFVHGEGDVCGFVFFLCGFVEFTKDVVSIPGGVGCFFWFPGEIVDGDSIGELWFFIPASSWEDSLYFLDDVFSGEDAFYDPAAVSELEVVDHVYEWSGLGHLFDDSFASDALYLEEEGLVGVGADICVDGFVGVCCKVFVVCK